MIRETSQPPELQPVLKLEAEKEKQSEAATTPLNPGKHHHHPCIPVPSFAVSYLLPNHTTTQFLLPGAQLETCAPKLCHSANCGHPQVDIVVVVVINNGQCLLLLPLLPPPLLNLKTLLCPMPGLNLQLFKKKAILGFLRAPSWWMLGRLIPGDDSRSCRKFSSFSLRLDRGLDLLLLLCLQQHTSCASERSGVGLMTPNLTPLPQILSILSLL